MSTIREVAAKAAPAIEKLRAGELRAQLVQRDGRFLAFDVPCAEPAPQPCQHRIVQDECCVCGRTIHLTLGPERLRSAIPAAIPVLAEE